MADHALTAASEKLATAEAFIRDAAFLLNDGSPDGAA